MKARVCICCGEPMVAKGNALSRNPNICASCSSLTNGMEGMEGIKPLDALENAMPAAREHVPLETPRRGGKGNTERVRTHPA